MASEVEKFISSFIAQQFPRRFREDGPLLVKFIEYYYQWMEQEGGVTLVSRQIPQFRDSLETTDYFFDFIRSEFMRDIPKNNLVDERKLIRRITDFYKAKGDQKAFRLLFRILYGIEIDFYYPGQDILRVSSGKWTVEKYVKVGSVEGDIDSLKNIVVVRGAISGATARIDRIERIPSGNNIGIYFYLTSIFGTFQSGEHLVNTIDNSNVAIVEAPGLQTKAGYWLNTDGFLSSDKKLQDNFYYQVYSYEINSTIQVNNYREFVKQLVHPAGTKMFGRYIVEINIDLGPSIEVQYFAGASSYNIQINVNFDVNPFLEVSFTNKIEPQTALEIDVPEIDLGLSGNINGRLRLLNDIISTYSSIPILELMNVPINMLGTRSLLNGANTSFVGQGIHQDSVLNIIDVGHAANGLYIVNPAPFSNTFLRITPQYAFTTLSNGTGTFNN